ncbi:ABC transporter ATP-binding protein [Streptomyces microflavus]|uniref:ABC transporter ATP-binding protein n=1 Tax=Streptomyces microflavus TaxID=1919 RepID=UPI00382C9325
MTQKASQSRHQRRQSRGSLRGRTATARQVFAMARDTDRRVTVLVLVLNAAQATAVAATAQSQRWLVDSAGTSHPSSIALAVALGVFAHTAMASFGRIQNNLANDLSDRMALTLSQEVLTVTAGIPGVEHLEHPGYQDRLTLLRKGARGLAAFGWAIVQTGASVLSLALSVWLLWGVHPALALLAFFAVPWLWLGHRAQRFLRRAQQDTAEAVRLELRLHELCLDPEAAKELYVAGSGHEISRRAAALWERTARAEARARLRGTALQSLGWLFFSLGLVGALATVAHLVTEQRAGAGDAVLVITLALQLRRQISATAMGLEQIGNAAGTADHYRWLKEYAAGRTAGDGPVADRLTEGIRLRDVSFRYPGADLTVLRGIDLFLPAGSVVGLVGVNGAGKSTLVKLLTGMYRPTGGTITVDGEPLAKAEPEAWAARSTGAFQDFVRFELPLLESVGLGDLTRIGDRTAVLDALHRAGTGDLPGRLPGGLSTPLGAAFDGVPLSVGQWQRLAVARAFMRRSPLLMVLDEPSASIDPQAEHELFERFAVEIRQAAQRAGAVTLLVSHRFSTVRMADHIVVLSDGKVVEQGSHDHLMADAGPYAALYGAQARGYGVVAHAAVPLSKPDEQGTTP